MTDTITRLGEKAIIDEEGNVSGWLAPFGGPFNGKDLDGEFFSARTEFALDTYPALPVMYAHGQDPAIEDAKVGEVSIKEIRDRGVWVQGQLDKQSAYYDVLRELASKTDVYWSSGAAPKFIKRDAKSGEIRKWPIVEATLTLTPANPLAEASVKDVTTTTEPETETSVGGKTVSIRVEVDADDAIKALTDVAAAAETAAATLKSMDPQSLHDLSLAMGAECPKGEMGEAKEALPADVLAPAGDDVERLTPADLAALKSTIVAVVSAELGRLTG